ncbi:MAG: DUF4426 domain-containing protein [Pseudomonas sp.]|nr:DUF4426 domain-containing protein [Pseudomonas sp.]
MRCLTAFVCALLLAVPALAAEAAKPERQETFSDGVTVYYNAITSSFLSPEMTTAAGLTRSKNLGVLNIAVFKDGKLAMANVSGTVTNEDGRKDNLTIQQKTEQGAVTYLAQFTIDRPGTYTFDVNVAIGDKINTLNFNQALFPGE